MPRSPQGVRFLERELEGLYDNFGPQLFTCALAVTHCRDLAEDAVHDAFCSLLRLDRKPDDLKAYAFRCVRNAAIDLVRRRGRTLPLENEESVFDHADSPRKSAEKKEFVDRVARAMAILSEDERETIVQHLFAGLAFREIAEIQNAPLGTVTARYRRGIAKLREEMEE